MTIDAPIRLLGKGLHVDEAVSQVAAHPEYWNLIPFRKLKAGTPHEHVNDIWVRYNAWDHFDGDHAKFNGPHESEWYPAADDLPAVVDLCHQVMTLVHGTRLGGVLITQIPPGQMVTPHIDGGWHAGYYEKFAVQLKGNQAQAFCFEQDELRTESGDLFTFRNDVPHWVTNPSPEDRMTLIICIRRD